MPEGDWLCRKCTRNAKKRESDRRRREAARQEAEAAKKAAAAARAAREDEKKKKQDMAGKKGLEQEVGVEGTQGEEDEQENQTVIDVDAVGVEVQGSLGSLIPDSWSSGIIGASDTGQSSRATGKRRPKEVKQLYTPEASFRKKEKPSFKKEKACSKKSGRPSVRREAEGYWDGDGDGDGDWDGDWDREVNVNGGRDEMMVDEGEVDEDDMLVDEDEYVVDEAEQGEDGDFDDEGRPIKKRRFRGPGKKIGRKKKPPSTGGGNGGQGGKGQRRAQPLASGGGRLE